VRESRRIFRFAVIGTLNALIIAAVIWLMMDELDIDYMLSNITAYVIAQTHNFIWCKHWIFPLDDKEKKSNTWRQEFYLPEVEKHGALNCDEYLAQFLGLFIYGGVNFIMNRRITFR